MIFRIVRQPNERVVGREKKLDSILQRLAVNENISEKLMLKLIDGYATSIFNHENITEKVALQAINNPHFAMYSTPLISDLKNNGKRLLTNNLKLQLAVIEKLMINNNPYDVPSYLYDGILKYTKFEEVMLFTLMHGNIKKYNTTKIISNPHITKKVKRFIFDYPDIEILGILAKCEYLDEEEIYNIIEASKQSMKYNPIYILAKNPTVPNHILKEIWDDNIGYRKYIAANPKLIKPIRNLVMNFIPEYLSTN